MALTLDKAPTASGVAMIGGTLTGVLGTTTGGVDPVTDAVIEWQASLDQQTWETAAVGTRYVVQGSDSTKYFRFLQKRVDSDTPPSELVMTTSVYGPVDGTVVFFDCTVGSPTQTSYICVEVADQLLQTVPPSPGVEEWLESDDENAKKRLLNLATQILDSLCWNGTKCSCDQALEWPRIVTDCSCELANCSEIPFDIQLATAYLAAWLSTKKDFAWTPGGGSLNGGGGSGGGTGNGGSIDTGNDMLAGLEPFEEVTIGPINVKMRASADLGGTWGWEYLPPFVQSLLWRWLCSDGPGGIGGAGASSFRQGNVGRGSVARIKNRLPWQVPGYMWLRDGVVYPRYGPGWLSFDDYYRRGR